MNKHTAPGRAVNGAAGLFPEISPDVVAMTARAVEQTQALEATGQPLPDALPVADEDMPGNYPMDWPHSRDIQGQQEVRILALQCGGVELRQATQHASPDDSEAPSIEVTSGNVARLVFGLLDAAGFKNITINTSCDDGEQDLKPGSMASDFTWSPPKPKPPVVVVVPKPAVVKTEPEPAPEKFDWDGGDDDSTVLAEQLQTAIYLNVRQNMVIRQRDAVICGGPYSDREDATIVIQRERWPAFEASVSRFIKENSRQ